VTHLEGGFYNMRLPGLSGEAGSFVYNRLVGRERVFRGLPARAAKGTCHRPGVLVGNAWMSGAQKGTAPRGLRGELLQDFLLIRR